MLLLKLYCKYVTRLLSGHNFLQYHHSELGYLFKLASKHATTTMAPTQERISMFTGGKTRRKHLGTKYASKSKSGGVKKSVAGILSRSQIRRYQNKRRLIERKYFQRLVDVILYDFKIEMLNASLPDGLHKDTPLPFCSGISRWSVTRILPEYIQTKVRQEHPL